MATDWAKLVPEITVSDFKRSLEFYLLLGFKVLWQREHPDFAYLDFEGGQLMLEAHHQTGWNTAPLEKPFGRGVNFQLECADAQTVRETLLQSGHLLYRDLKETWYETGETTSGTLELLVQDPDGYLLRFSEFLGEKQATSEE